MRMKVKIIDAHIYVNSKPEQKFKNMHFLSCVFYLGAGISIEDVCEHCIINLGNIVSQKQSACTDR